MPTIEEHNELFDKIGLSRYKWVNRVMDANTAVFGPAHRICPMHDPLSGILLAIIHRDPKVAFAHFIHNVHDFVTSPGYFLYIGERIMRMFRQVMRK